MVISSKDGRLKELDVKTEWKNKLKRVAFSLSELAEEESNETVDGTVLWLLRGRILKHFDYLLICRLG